MTIQTLNKSSQILEIEKKVKDLMSSCKVSPKTGFLTEDPLRYLPTNGPKEQVEYFKQVDEIGYSLEKLIKEKKIEETIKKLPVPKFSFSELEWKVVNRLMLVIAMITHAYFREKYPFKNVMTLMQDESNKTLPSQLAVPLWNLSKITGIAPSMSYGLYSLWNYYKKDPNKPISLENIDMIHSFSGTLDEKWFVWIHQIIEATFSQAIPELGKAYFIVKENFEDGEEVIGELTLCLDKAANVTREIANILERMREHCDYKTYFDSVRLFYSIPRNIIFEGVNELGGKPQELYGETGGQTPYMHFQLTTLGITHNEDPFFNNMQKHMLKNFRDFLGNFQNSKVRDFVVANKKNKPLVRRYNMLVQNILDWRMEHISLVDDYIKEFGEVHGTGKPPLDWLKSLYLKTKSYLID